MSGLTAEGFTPKTLEEILSDLEDSQHADIDTGLDTSAESVLGKLNGTFASPLRECWELLGAVYESRDPDKNTGDAQDATAAISGTRRRAATNGFVALRMSVAANTTVPAGAVAHVTGQPTNRWVTTAAAVNATGSTAWVENVAAEAESTGVIAAVAGTLAVIAQPVTGWLAVANLLDATPGLAIETHSELRIRRELELQRPGSSPLDAIRADLLDVTGVVAVVMYENTTDTTDAEGLPPHSVEAVAQQGTATDLAVATQLWNSKAGGIATHSSESPPRTVSVVSSQGTTRLVKFTRPASRSVYLDIVITTDPDLYAGNAALKAALVAYGTEHLTMGADVIRARLLCEVIDFPGVTDVVTLHLGFGASPTGDSNLLIAPREIAMLDTSRITVSP
jgi:uncharacterized phage protein gp47/JayE